MKDLLDSHLHILWTTDNVTTAEEMVFKYALNGRLQGWWDRVTLIIWGASTRLTAENERIQAQLQDLISAGVHISACKGCSDNLHVSNILEEQGIEVKYWGAALADLQKKNAKIVYV